MKGNFNETVKSLQSVIPAQAEMTKIAKFYFLLVWCNINIFTVCHFEAKREILMIIRI